MTTILQEINMEYPDIARTKVIFGMSFECKSLLNIIVTSILTEMYRNDCVIFDDFQEQVFDSCSSLNKVR